MWETAFELELQQPDCFPRFHHYLQSAESGKEDPRIDFILIIGLHAEEVVWSLNDQWKGGENENVKKTDIGTDIGLGNCFLSLF